MVYNQQFNNNLRFFLCKHQFLLKHSKLPHLLPIQIIMKARCRPDQLSNFNQQLHYFWTSIRTSPFIKNDLIKQQHLTDTKKIHKFIYESSFSKSLEEIPLSPSHNTYIVLFLSAKYMGIMELSSMSQKFKVTTYVNFYIYSKVFYISNSIISSQNKLNIA